MQILEDALKFQQWKTALEDNNIEIEAIKPLHLIHKPNKEIIFALLEVDAKDDKEQSLLPVVLLRGHFVSVVTVLIDQASKEKHLLLVGQRRIANGSVFFEHPAGMCDNSTDPFDVAIKEVQEETGLGISREQLYLLQDEILFTSPGLLDEGGYLMACEIEMSKEAILSFDQQSTGAADEEEYITTKVVPINDAMSLFRSMPPKLALYMYLESSSKDKTI